ncbi:MAG TPA: alcohol dehydrogenase catalytic domain-containing protein [Candidatus Aphodomonas merdavium]|nr:alcohol dehydrogenase catalytic domain-containing protein [Candidatus Aphodomonas merdavium]
MLKEVMTAPGKIAFVEVPVPEPGENQVLVRMEKIGICGSDIHVYHGEHPYTSYPVTQGHEVSGVVEKVGAGVSAFHPGQKVTIEPQVVCGKCHPCRTGHYNNCETLAVMGFQCEGAAAQYFAVDQSKVDPLPDDFSLDDAAMIEPLAVAVHAVQVFGDVTGKDVCVIGAGPIGILVAQVAKGLGARKVMATDVSDYRLALARTCGVDVTYNTRQKDFGEALVEAFGEDKADVIFDCAGNNTTIGQAILHARKCSVIVLVAVFVGMATVDLAMLNDHELDLKTSMMYRHEHYLEAIRLIAEGKVQLKPLQTKHFPFQEYLAAYRYIDENRETTMKVIIDVQA